LKERVSELFKKRNPDEAMENSQSKPAENKNGERTATRRNDNAEANVVVTDVSDQVEIKTNKIADSWMMGVKNLKLTLSNRSKLTINSAKVEVLYYSEQNNLLDKKILSFSNIPPGKSQTVPAPDQRLADHIEYKILSANGVDNAYAKQ
jgi:P pilus assembly chaperone PapD